MINKIAIILTLIFIFSIGYANPFAAGGGSNDKPVVKKVEKPANSFYNYLNEKQRELKNNLSETFSEIKEKPFSPKLLYYLAICFIYGIFHSMGPGHAKTLVSSYVVGSKINLKQSALFGMTVAIGHAFTAFIIVSFIFYILKSPVMAGFDLSSGFLSKFAYGLVLSIGVVMLLKKILKKGHHHHHKSDEKSFLFSALAVGVVPCPGAMVLTIFAVTGGTLLTGFISVLSMALGMSVTIVTVSVLSYYFRYLGTKVNLNNGALVHNAIEFGGILMIIAFSSFMLF